MRSFARKACFYIIILIPQLNLYGNLHEEIKKFKACKHETMLQLRFLCTFYIA